MSKTKGKTNAPTAAPTIQLGVQIDSLQLVALSPSPSGFNFESTLFTQYLRTTLQTNKQTIIQNSKLTLSVFGETQQFMIQKIVPDQALQQDEKYLVTQDTKIEIIKPSDEDDNEETKQSTENETTEYVFEADKKEVQFAGYDKQVKILAEILDLKLVSKRLTSIKGVLVHGPAGVGKTIIIHSALKSQNLKVMRVTPSDLLSGADQFEKIKKVFRLAAQSDVLWFEELDFIAKSKDKDLFYGFLEQLDTYNGPALIIATTNKLAELDKAVRRGGRLDLDLRLDMPNEQDRFEILQSHLDHLMLNGITQSELREISRAASGFVGSDLAQIIRNAHLIMIQSQKLQIDRYMLEASILEAKPLSIQDLLVEVPRTLWADIGGSESIKFKVKQCVEWPLKFPEKFQAVGIKPPQGILLYGPPGCSKTMIAKALATESGLNFIAIKGPELFSKYVGDTEKAIREIFRKARLSSPSIIFFDEIDAMATQRGDDETNVSDRALCQLLNEMDGVEARSQVIVVGATNRLDIIDSALLRPGRFDRLIHVPLPDTKTRKGIFEINLSKMQASQEAKDSVGQLADQCEGMSGAEIALVCREAGLLALSLDNNIEMSEASSIFVQESHLKQALTDVRARGQQSKKTLF